MCISGSHRIIETDYDDAITVVSSGGLGGSHGDRNHAVAVHQRMREREREERPENIRFITESQLLFGKAAFYAVYILY